MTRLARNIRTSGAILPSSKFLIERLLRPIDFSAASTIVELGIGTGCVTRALLEHMAPGTRLVCVEMDEEFVATCADIADERLAVYHACATDLAHVLADAGVVRVDHIVSSIPLTLLGDATADTILEVAQASLRPGGKFLQYQYSLAYLRKLTSRYGDVRWSFTLRNVPPAFVYECVNSTIGAEA